ncbi:MAG: twin-arginine translocase TatA/TatE family subunit [Alphaproteobacteria bacterium]
MHTPGLVPLLIILVLAFLLFGRPGRLSGMMEDLGKGIKGFRKGMSEGDTPPPPKQETARIVDQTPASESSTTQTKTEA